MSRQTLASILVCAVVVLDPSSVRGFPGPINVFNDPGAGSCLIADPAPGLLFAYVVQWGSTGSMAAQFRVETGAGFTGVFVSHTVAPGFLELGTPPTDYSVAYGGCLTGTIHIVTLVYIAFGTSASCSRIDVLPTPTSPIPGEIVVVDCDSNVIAGATSGPAVVNYLGTCPAWCIGATEASTWGRVKALYR